MNFKPLNAMFSQRFENQHNDKFVKLFAPLTHRLKKEANCNQIWWLDWVKVITSLIECLLNLN